MRCRGLLRHPSFSGILGSDVYTENLHKRYTPTQSSWNILKRLYLFIALIHTSTFIFRKSISVNPGGMSNTWFRRLNKLPWRWCTSPDSDWVHSLHWRHNEGDGVSNHQPHDGLLNRLFRQTKENIKAPRHWPLCGEFTGDRWISRTKGQKRGKCFRLMTSSWLTLPECPVSATHLQIAHQWM